MSGWYNSAMNYETLSCFPRDTMNLQMNQLLDDSIALNGFHKVPIYDFNNFMPYGSPNTNSYLTNPCYTINQMSWGTPAWNNLPWNNGGNWSNNWSNNWSPFGWSGGSFSGSGGGNSNVNSTANQKYNRLRNLVTQLAKYEYLGASDQDLLNEALRNSKGTAEEKYDKLLDAYNEIDKDIVREFLAEAHKLGVKSKISNEKDKDTFYNRLVAAGHEYSDTDMDDKVDDFYDGIAKLKDNNGTDETCKGIIGLINNGSGDILDFISSWNNNYKNTSGSERVIDHFDKYYSKIKDKDLQKTAKGILEALVDELTDKAQQLKKHLNDDSEKDIEKAINEVEKALEETKAEGESHVSSKLSKAFDKLYLYTRQAAMTELRNDAKSYYGEIDKEVFNDKLFNSDMIKDLESEGFTTSEIEGAEVVLDEKRTRSSRSRRNGDSDDSDDSSSSALKDIDKKAAVEQVAILKDEEIIEELTVKKDGTTTLYQEKTKTGDSDGDGKADYAKLFYINNDGKLVEWKNTKLNSAGTGTEIVKVGVAQGEGTIKPSEISKAKVKAEKAAEEEKEKAEALEGYDPATAGKKVAEALTGDTDDTADRRVASLINENKLSKDNILIFLENYYDTAGYGGEGLLEYLDDDCSSVVTIDMRTNLVDSIIEKAKELGLTNEDSYKELITIYNEWNDIKTSDDNDFTLSYKNGTWAWIGAATTFAEAMDEQIEILVPKMIEENK